MFRPGSPESPRDTGADVKAATVDGNVKQLRFLHSEKNEARKERSSRAVDRAVMNRKLHLFCLMTPEQIKKLTQEALDFKDSWVLIRKGRSFDSPAISSMQREYKLKEKVSVMTLGLGVILKSELGLN